MDNANTDHDFNDAKDLLQDVESAAITYEYASQGQRFLNWLIDNLFIRYAVGYISGIVWGLMLREFAPDFLNKIAAAQQNNVMSIEFYLLAFFIAIVNYFIYYTFCEKLFKGYTLGKLITGTRAIRQDGDELTFKDAALRSLSRCVPFEVFSGFSTLPWHDSWTNTMVIKSR
jgi:uncharacterized RDD family membrane protein YckC